MQPQEHATPRPHVVVDDCLSSAHLALFLEHMRGLESRMTVGMVRKRSGFEKSKVKENRVLFVDDNDEDPHAQAVLGQLRALAWSDTVLDFLENADAPLFQVLQYTEAPSIQVSRYADDGQYGFHKDIGNKTNLTVLFFACAEPRGFTGGDFVMRHGEEEKTISYRNNRLLIFPSSTPHRVTPVKAQGDDFACARFSLQIWPAIAPGKTKGPRSMQILQREDQARHPLRPEFAVKARDIAGSEAFYRALFSGESLALEDLALGAFGRLGGRLQSNLDFVAGSLYPNAKFQAHFHNLPCDAEKKVRTHIYLCHGTESQGLVFGYRLRTEGDTFKIQSELYASITTGEATFEHTAGTDLSEKGQVLQETLAELIENCAADVEASAGIPEGLGFLART